MSFADKYGPCALVVGAAIGLGAEFSRQLAAQGVDLILVSLEDDELAALAKELEAAHGIRAQTVAGDITAPETLDRIELCAAGTEIGLVVYNAGLSICGEWLDTPLESHLKVLDVNVTGMYRVVHRYAAPMLERGRGGVILLSSMSGLLGTPMYASYASTKALTLHLAETLWEEWRSKGVDITAVIPGATETPGYRKDNPRDNRSTPDVMPVGPVVAAGLNALGKRPSVIPGRLNKFSGTLLTRLLPRRTAIGIMGRSMRSTYGGR
ncbi:SDR family NAD(P)-dependent oxidoreductase [Nocardia sp. NPDC003693]